MRFLFRNGTEADNELQAYSLFNRPKEQFDMSWTDFTALMNRIQLQGTEEWCTVCGGDGSEIPFCAAAEDRYPGRRSSSGLSPVVSGIIGAVVTLALVAMILGAVMLFAGVRFHRSSGGSRKSDLGGFKGGRKMASDQDLTIPKGGAVVGAVFETPSQGHERHGSWELKGPPTGAGGEDDGEWRSARPSMEQIRAVEPHERV